MSSDLDDRILLWENEVLLEPDHLQEGHFVARMDRPWMGTPFPLEGVLIQNSSQSAWFRDRCQWVVVDLLRSAGDFKPTRRRSQRIALATRSREHVNDEQASINVLRRASLDQAIVDESLDMHAMLHQQAESLVHGISVGGRLDSGQARDMVSTIASRLEKNAAAMVWLTRIKAVDQYTAQHCVNVAIVSMGLAQALEWPRERIEWAGLAGLLHDIGKMKLDTAVLNKRGRLSAEEYEQIKQHSRLGYEILVEDSLIPPAVAMAVLYHHERPDGLGYPTGKSTRVLDPLCGLVAVADAYDAITSTRPYRTARSHHEALGILWKQRGTQFERGLVESLIQFLGWITPGTLVRLSDGQAAIVLRASHHHRLWPLVRLIDQSQGDGRIGEMLDLAEYNEHHPQSRLRVAEVLTDGALRLDLRRALRHQASDPSIDD